jgi:hypothetical protein
MTDKFRGHSRSPLDTRESKKIKREEVFIFNQSIRLFFYEICFLGK